MEDNTAATPTFPDGSPTQDDPVKESPIMESPIENNPTMNNPTLDNALSANPLNASVGPPHRPKGPNVSAIVLGLVALVIGGLIIANETTGLRVDWSRLGPGAIIGIGFVLVVLGAIGLVRRHDEA